MALKETKQAIHSNLKCFCLKKTFEEDAQKKTKELETSLHLQRTEQCTLLSAEKRTWH